MCSNDLKFDDRHTHFLSFTNAISFIEKKTSHKIKSRCFSHNFPILSLSLLGWTTIIMSWIGKNLHSKIRFQVLHFIHRKEAKKSIEIACCDLWHFVPRTMKPSTFRIVDDQVVWCTINFWLFKLLSYSPVNHTHISVSGHKNLAEDSIPSLMSIIENQFSIDSTRYMLKILQMSYQHTHKMMREKKGKMLACL